MSKASDLSLGEIVFKAHEPGESGYDADTINRSYKNSPDKRDYYHVGVVTSVQPLEITHCTGVSGGIKRDSTLGQWRWAGQLNLVNYNEGGDEPLEALYQAVTTANNSYPIRMRKSASQNSAVLIEVPQGEKVDVLEETRAAWDKARYNGVVGYMMVKFLSPVSNDAGAPAADTNVVCNSLTPEFPWFRRLKGLSRPWKGVTDLGIVQLITWAIALGIPSGLIGFLWGKVKGLHKDNLAVKEGVQALLRAQMIADYNHYVEKGFAPIYARQNFENCWQRYHALGANGVMDDIRSKFMALPTSVP